MMVNYDKRIVFRDLLSHRKEFDFSFHQLCRSVYHDLVCMIFDFKCFARHHYVILCSFWNQNKFKSISYGLSAVNITKQTSLFVSNNESEQNDRWKNARPSFTNAPDS